jgi:hypothetical protein
MLRGLKWYYCISLRPLMMWIKLSTKEPSLISIIRIRFQWFFDNIAERGLLH